MFILLLKQGVYPYEYTDNWEGFDNEYMDNWEGFYKISLPSKKVFNSELYPEHITNKNYAHA